MKAPLLLLFITSIFGLAAIHGVEVIAPQPGTPLRQTILDDLRAAEPTATTVKEKKQKIVFEKVVVRVVGDWAWVSAEPRSADNKWRSEPLTGLMHHQGGRWKVVQYVGDEVSSSARPQVAYQAWRTDLLKKNPECPPELVPFKEKAVKGDAGSRVSG
jgi:hypothetical protein